MNILITGATGFLGSRLVEAFSEKETFCHIIATGRHLQKDRKVISPKVQYVLGDLSNDFFVESLFKNNSIDVIVNCASFSSPWGTYKTYYKANCLTQSNLIAAAKKHGIQRFIYISTPSIYFDFNDKIGIKETDELPKSLVNHYASTKYQAEQLLEASGLGFITLRPRALIGRGDTVIMPRLIRSYKEGRLKIIGNGNNMVDLTPVSNMVQAVERAIQAPEISCNQAYNISNGKSVSLWTAINKMLVDLGMERINQKVPYHLAYLVASVLEKKASLLGGKEPVLTRYSVGVLSKSFTMNIDKAKENLGYFPQQSTEAAMKEFVEWHQIKSFAEQPYLNNI